MLKPKPVTYAVGALWGALTFLGANLIFNAAAGNVSMARLAGGLFGLLAWAIIIWRISAGRNWARYVYAVALAYCFARIAAAPTPNTSWQTLLDSLLGGTTLMALILMFCPASSAWFKRK